MQEMLAPLNDKRVNANGFKKVQGISRDVSISCFCGVFLALITTYNRLLLSTWLCVESWLHSPTILVISWSTVPVTSTWWSFWPPPKQPTRLLMAMNHHIFAWKARGRTGVPYLNLQRQMVCSANIPNELERGPGRCIPERTWRPLLRYGFTYPRKSYNDSLEIEQWKFPSRYFLWVWIWYM